MPASKATRHATKQSPRQATKIKKNDDETHTEDEDYEEEYDTSDESNESDSDSDSHDGSVKIGRREPKEDKKRKKKPIQPREKFLKPAGIGDEVSLAKILQHLKYHQTEITSVFAEGKARTLMRASLHESLHSTEETSITKEHLDTHGCTDPIIIFERPLPHIEITDQNRLLIQITDDPLPIYEWKIDVNELSSAMFDSIQPSWDNEIGMYVKGYSMDTSVAKFKAAFALESDDTQLGAIIQRLVAVMQDVIEQSKGGPLGV